MVIKKFAATLEGNMWGAGAAFSEICIYHPLTTIAIVLAAVMSYAITFRKKKISCTSLHNLFSAINLEK